MQGPVLATAS